MLETKLDTVVVLMTGSGRGAVASLLLAGPKAKSIVADRFQPFQRTALSNWRPDKPYFGNWTWDNYSEELVVCQTGDQQYEIHCHGGRLASRQIIESIVAAGDAKEVSQRDWLRSNEPDSFVAAAQILLADVMTERTAAIAMSQVRGAMRQRLSQIRTWIENGQNDDAAKALDRLVELGEVGVRLQTPFSVVLIGPPNTGKSSLINAMVGYQRSVVFDQPGTTRDLVRVETAIDGWPIRLTDTAGVRESHDQIEQEGIRLARETLRSADLALVIVDLSCAESTTEFSVDDDVPRITLGTKLDLVPDREVAGSLDRWRHLPLDAVTSAETGEGIDSLNELVASRLVPSNPETGEAIPLGSEVVEAISEVRSQLASDDATAAMQSLDELLAC